jgi:hypothetical protein
MVNNLHLLHYESISEFKRQFYKDLLTIDHLQGGEVHIQKLKYPDGTEDDEANFWGFKLKKDNVSYLLPNKMKDGTKWKASELLPIKPQDLEKVSYRGDVYWQIKKPIKARFIAEKKMTFKMLVDTLSDIEHSNPTHRKLLVMLGFSSMMERCNFRVCSPPSFGKDSVVDTFGALFGSATTILRPTTSKLEFMTSYKWLAINEAVDIQEAEWKRIEQFLLDAGAHKPEITKQSRAYEGVGETLDISNFSISLFYNDYTDYQGEFKYFDTVAKAAVLDRFPAFRLHGNFKANFNEIRKVDVAEFVTKNLATYKDLVHTYTYYKQNLNEELHYYSINKLRPFKSQRWSFNVGKLLKIIDLYCDSQEEFDEWIKVVNSSINDYQDMVEFERVYNAVKGKIIKECLKNEKLVNERMGELNASISKKVLFAEKLEVLKELSKNKKKDEESFEDINYWGEQK